LKRYEGSVQMSRSMTNEELANRRSQLVTFTSDRMGLGHPPMAFSEQGWPCYATKGASAGSSSTLQSYQE